MVDAADGLLTFTEIATSCAIVQSFLAVHVDLIGLNCGHLQHFFLFDLACFISFLDQSLRLLILIN